MSRDLSDLYRSLARDADERELGTPDAIRHYADRRARLRAAGAALATALVVGGLAVGVQTGLAGGPDDPPPATTPSPAPTSGSPSPSPSPSASPPPTPSAPATSPSSVPPATPTSIPGRAFFAPPAAYLKEEPTYNDGDHVPDLCGADLADRVVQRRSRLIIYHLKPNQPEYIVPDGTYQHTITIHRRGTADDWMANLRRAVRDCPRQETDPGMVYRHRLLSDSGYGDESVLFEIRSPSRVVAGEPEGEEMVGLLRAIRIGDVVTILWERGYEGSSTVREQFEDYSRRAERAVEAWLG